MGRCLIKKHAKPITYKNFIVHSMTNGSAYGTTAYWDSGVLVEKGKMVGITGDGSNGYYSAYRVYIDYSPDNSTWTRFYNTSSSIWQVNVKDIENARYYRLQATADGNINAHCTLMVMF